MLDLNATLDNLIALVVVLLALSLVVQAVQSAVKKMFKLKSRQIEDSLAHLFQFALRNETTAELKTAERASATPGDDPQLTDIWAAKWRGVKALFAQSPFLRVLVRMPHPAQDKEYAAAGALYNEVLNKFRGLGRTALSTRPIFDSMSKGDLLKVIGSIDPHAVDHAFSNNFAAAVGKFKEFYALFTQWEEWLKGPDFAAGQYLTDEDRARLAGLQAKFAPLLADVSLLLTGKSGTAEAVEVPSKEVILQLAGDIAKLRAVNLDDAKKVLDDVGSNVAQAAARARLGGKTDVAAALDALSARLKEISAGFVSFRQTYNTVFAKWVKLEESFDSVMQSFEERYTRSMKTAAVVISFFVVVFLNANFFKVYETISTSDVQRQLILQSRQQVVEALARGLPAAPAVTPREGETPEQAAARARDEQTRQTVQSWFKASEAEVRNSADAFVGYGFKPITLQETRQWLGTWRTGNPWTNFKHDAKVLLGWILMALLLSVGAPFWQDFLESLFGVKNVLRRSSSTRNVEQAPGAGQTRQ